VGVETHADVTTASSKIKLHVTYYCAENHTAVTRKVILPP